MTLYLIRHGESTANAGHLHAGWAQISLSAAGRAQAEKAGKLIAGIPFERVISSDLKRAEETCCLALPGREYEKEPLIREISVGSLSGKNAEECATLYGELYADNKRVQNFVPFGGEDRTALLERISAFMRKAETFQEMNVAVFTHEGVLRGMLDLVLGEQDRNRVVCGNCCIAVFEYAKGSWRLYSWMNQ